MAWLVENIRFTGFFSEPTNPVKQDWWEEVMGVAPDSSDIQRGESRRTDVGVLDGLNILLQATPERFDWIVSVAGQEMSRSPLGLSSESGLAPERVLNLHKRFSVLPAVQRIALGLTVAWPVEDKVEAYKLLDKFLPAVTLDPLGSQDFTYRINRPRTVTVAGREAKLNRVTTWAARQRTIMFHRLPVNIDAGVPMALPMQQTHAMQCEMDLSSDALSTNKMGSAEVTETFAVFFQYASEVMEKGDVA